MLLLNIPVRNIKELLMAISRGAIRDVTVTIEFYFCISFVYTAQ